MKIISLILENYHRLLLSNVTRLEYRPIEKMQLIIGSNGSGKSSLLRELTPLPAVKNEYTPEGLKIITIEYLGSIYILTSNFKTGKTHSFLKDNVELNESGTFSIQKDLVKAYFKITFEIHEMLISSTTFTEYSLVERRKWFTMISDTDYTFALLAYQKLKDRQRDILGGIKLSKAKLTTLETNILTEEDINNLKNEIKKDYQDIEDLLSLKNNQINYKDISAEYEKHIGEINRNISLLKNTYHKVNLNLLSKNLENRLIEITTQVDYLEIKNKELENQFNEHTKTIEILTENNIGELSVTQDKLQDLFNETISLTKSLRYDFANTDPENLKLAINTNEHALNHIFDHLEPNINKAYSKANYENLFREIDTLKGILINDKSKRESLFLEVKKLEHLKNHDKIDCPQCHYEWILGYDENVHLKTIAEHQQIILDIENKEALLVKLETQLENMREYLNTYRQYLYIKDTWPILSILFDILDSKSIMIENPKTGNSILYQIKADLETAIKIKHINKEISDLQYVLNITKDTNNLNLDNLKDLQSQVGTQININIQKIQSLLNEYKLIENQIKNKAKIVETINALGLNLKSMDNHYQESLLQIQNNIIMDLVKAIKYNLNDKEEKLSTSLSIFSTIEETNKTLAIYEEELDQLNILVDLMSPTNGLIGDSILGFINVFIEQVNNIIKQIWSYPMTIMNCNIDENNSLELNYRFPVLVKQSTRPVPDIKRVSSGMKEVIDLAFKIISMKYLGLENYPLYLDEFGKTFDSQHRKTAINIINNLLMQSDFSQLFLVSHYEDNYGALTNSDINVLCKENVVVPDKISNRLLIA